MSRSYEKNVGNNQIFERQIIEFQNKIIDFLLLERKIFNENYLINSYDIDKFLINTKNYYSKKFNLNLEDTKYFDRIVEGIYFELENINLELYFQKKQELSMLLKDLIFIKEDFEFFPYFIDFFSLTIKEDFIFVLDILLDYEKVELIDYLFENGFKTKEDIKQFNFLKFFKNIKEQKLKGNFFLDEEISIDLFKVETIIHFLEDK